MKAQLLTRFGSVDNFEPAEVPTPTPDRGQVLVRVAAIGLNGVECKIRNGWLQDAFPTPLPAILGKEIAGTVTALGPEVTTLSVGDRVVGFTESGAYAQYCTTRVEALAPLPGDVPFETAATLPVAAETASRGLRALDVQAGATVVVNGAAGTVGSAVVQLLIAQAVTVIGTASEANHAHVDSLGATSVTYGNGVKARILSHAPHGVDAVFDAAGHGFAPTAIELTGDPQRVLTIADFKAATLGIQTSVGSRTPTADSFVPVLSLLAAGRFRTIIDSVYALAEIAAAHTRSEGGRPRGKIVVTV